MFYLNAILVLPFVLIAFFVIPKSSTDGDKKRQLDAFGVGTLTAALILFVYAISDGNEAGKCSSSKEKAIGYSLHYQDGQLLRSWLP